MSIPIKIVIPVIIIVAVVASYASSRAALIEGNENNTQCQYPTRPLVDGHCDNMEPDLVQEPPATPVPVAPTPVTTAPSCSK
jgi:hypothetical protein